jgi:hypothetical protein
MSNSDDSAYSQHRIFAESCVLRCIGELDAAAKNRLMDACKGAPYKTADEALDDFERSEALTVAQVEWIQGAWRDRKSANPKDFAAEVASDVFSDIDF